MPMALFFWEVVLAIHIAAVVVAFGVVFAYPIIFTFLARHEPRSLGAMHRTGVALERRLTMPGLTVVLIAGIYLASKLELWSSFFVQWGMGVVIVLGGLSGMFFIPHAKRLAALADRDVAAAPAQGELEMSAEYQALSRRVAIVGGIANLLVLATIYFMATQTGR
jgi:uncharacterized membrane protein